MKEITYREFQRGFCKIKGCGEELVVYGRGGELIGRWIPASVGHAEGSEGVEDVGQQKVDVGQVMSDKREKFNKLKALFDAEKMVEGIKGVMAVGDEGVESEILSVEEVLRCKKCGRAEAMYYWNAWEDGEEYKNFPLCPKCAFRKPGIKLIKQTNGG